MQFGYVLLQFSLVDPVVPQVQFLQERQWIIQKNGQTILGELVAGQHKRLHWPVPDEVGKNGYLLVREAYIDQFNNKDVLKVEHA